MDGVQGQMGRNVFICTRGYKENSDISVNTTKKDQNIYIKDRMNYRVGKTVCGQVAMIKRLGHVYINTIFTWFVEKRPMRGGRLTGVAKFTAFIVHILERRFSG
jgi:hypothetical protein